MAKPLQANKQVSQLFPGPTKMTMSGTKQPQRDDMHPVGTELQPSEEREYRKWMEKIGHTSKNGFAVTPVGYHGINYDYRGYFKKYGDLTLEPGEDLTDEFKYPNHPTFSLESIYAKGQNIKQAGLWKTDPGVTNSTEFVPSKLRVKTQKEKDDERRDLLDLVYMDNYDRYTSMIQAPNTEIKVPENEQKVRMRHFVGGKPGIRNGTMVSPTLLKMISVAAAKEGYTEDQLEKEVLPTLLRETGIGHVYNQFSQILTPHNVTMAHNAVHVNGYPHSFDQFVLKNNLIDKKFVNKGRDGYSTLPFLLPQEKQDELNLKYKNYLDNFKVDSTLYEPFRADLRFLKDHTGQKYNPREKDRPARLKMELDALRQNPQLLKLAKDTFRSVKR